MLFLGKGAEPAEQLADGVYDHLLDDALLALVGDVGPAREAAVADLEPGRTPSFVAAHLKPLVAMLRAV